MALHETVIAYQVWATWRQGGISPGPAYVRPTIGESESAGAGGRAERARGGARPLPPLARGTGAVLVVL